MLLAVADRGVPGKAEVVFPAVADLAVAGRAVVVFPAVADLGVAGRAEVVFPAVADLAVAGKAVVAATEAEIGVATEAEIGVATEAEIEVVLTPLDFSPGWTATAMANSIRMKSPIACDSSWDHGWKQPASTSANRST